MATPLTKGSPKRLYAIDIDDPNLNKNYRRSLMYYRKLYLAWPDWCATHPEFVRIHREWQRRAAAGEDVHKDHIVPICSDVVCGLMVPWNLEVVTAKQNYRKSNKVWPDMPDLITEDMFGMPVMGCVEQYEFGF